MSLLFFYFYSFYRLFYNLFILQRSRNCKKQMQKVNQNTLLLHNFWIIFSTFVSSGNIGTGSVSNDVVDNFCFLQQFCFLQVDLAIWASPYSCISHVLAACICVRNAHAFATDSREWGSEWCPRESSFKDAISLTPFSFALLRDARSSLSSSAFHTPLLTFLFDVDIICCYVQARKTGCACQFVY